MKIVKISDIFDVVKGKSLYTKSYGMWHKWDYPVFSASNNEPLTFIDSFDLDGTHITWATNGFAWYIKVIKWKFNVNWDRWVLVPKCNNIDIDYVQHILEPILRWLAKGRKWDNSENEFTKVYPWMVEQVEIEIPTNEIWDFDLQAQQEIASQYVLIDEFKTKIKDYQERIGKLQVLVEEVWNIKDFLISDICVFEKDSKASMITKQFVDINHWDYDVYSGNTIEWVFWKINDYSYSLTDFPDENVLLISTVWYAWKVKKITAEKFSLSQNCWILYLKSKESINFKYLHYILEQQLQIFLSSHENYKSLLKKHILETTIKIPTLPNWSFDLAKQQEIAEIYESIGYVKSKIAEKLQILQDLQVII